MDAMQDLCTDDLDKGSNMDQRVAQVEKKTCSTLLEVNVIPWWPFKTSEHMQCSCQSKGDATWLVHEWAYDQMDQLGLSVSQGRIP